MWTYRKSCWSLPSITGWIQVYTGEISPYRLHSSIPTGSWGRAYVYREPQSCVNIDYSPILFRQSIRCTQHCQKHRSGNHRSAERTTQTPEKTSSYTHEILNIRHKTYYVYCVPSTHYDIFMCAFLLYFVFTCICPMYIFCNVLVEIRKYRDINVMCMYLYVKKRKK